MKSSPFGCDTSEDLPDDTLFSQPKEPKPVPQQPHANSNQHRALGPPALPRHRIYLQDPQRNPTKISNPANKRIPAPRLSRSTSRRNRSDNRPYADHKTRKRVMFDHQPELPEWTHHLMDQRSFPKLSSTFQNKVLPPGC